MLARHVRAPRRLAPRSAGRPPLATGLERVGLVARPAAAAGARRDRARLAPLEHRESGLEARAGLSGSLEVGAAEDSQRAHHPDLAAIAPPVGPGVCRARRAVEPRWVAHLAPGGVIREPREVGLPPHEPHAAAIAEAAGRHGLPAIRATDRLRVDVVAMSVEGLEEIERRDPETGDVSCPALHAPAVHVGPLRMGRDGSSGRGRRRRRGLTATLDERHGEEEERGFRARHEITKSGDVIPWRTLRWLQGHAAKAAQPRKSAVGSVPQAVGSGMVRPPEKRKSKMDTPSETSMTPSSFVSQVS